MPLYLPKQTTTQPATLVRLNRNIGLTTGLVGVFNFAIGNTNLIDGSIGVVTDSGTISNGAFGANYGIGASGSCRTITDATAGGVLFTSGATSHFGVSAFSSIDNPWGGFFSVSDSLFNQIIGIQRNSNTSDLVLYRSNAGTPRTFSGAVTSIADGKIHKWCITASDGGSQNSKLYLDGVELTGTGGSATTTSASGTARLRFFAGRDADPAFGADGKYFLHYIWNRALSKSEVESISANPYQIFAPLSLVYLPTGAAPPVTTIYEFQSLNRGVGRGIARGIA